jgi:hypothetical protein
MSGVDACVGLLEIPLCCFLKEKRSKHEFDGNTIFVLVLFRFASFTFQMTPTANRRHHTRNLVHGKLAVDDTSNHCITRYSKTCVKIIQTTIYIASRRSPNVRHNFVGRAVGSERSAVIPKKCSKLKKMVLRHTISHSEGNRIAAVIWDKESV